MSAFQDVAIKSDNGTLEDRDEWELSEDSDVLDSDDEESNNSGFEYDEDNRKIVEEDANRFEINIDSNLPDWKLIETKKGKIAIEQGEKLVAICADKFAEDIDPLCFLLVFSRLLSEWARNFCEESIG